ncbi:hypothetical protein LOAG_06876 [Loa loa]|uniref:DM domain-containing protein n=1 Tax=Loa loa TaxID=7209 RepID=A0A1I7V914_LOALO|nr:hypothetical protein LOAG_06876 [Loa loa]EFO21611.1 hypothetical protein LOAG_06876 [Loa loa]
MTSNSTSESSNFCWRSSTKDPQSSEHLNEGARPVFSKHLVVTNDGIRDFIPEYIREKFGESIEPNQCTIKAIYKADTKKLFYTFILSWYKNEAYVTTDSSGIAISKSKKSLINAPTKSEQIRRCDGPCGKMRPVKELRIHGRCEHAICQHCTINAPMIENADGTIGCCNEECFATNLAAVCPDPTLRHKYFQKIIENKINEIIATGDENQDYNMKRLQQVKELTSPSQTSSISKSSKMKQSLEELLCVNMLIFEKGPMETICRRRSITEINSAKSLRSILQWIVGYGQNLHKCRVFFNCNGNDDDSKFDLKQYDNLQEINLKRYGDKKISTFPSINGTLSFVVDYTNLIGGNPISPYI